MIQDIHPLYLSNGKFRFVINNDGKDFNDILIKQDISKLKSVLTSLFTLISPDTEQVKVVFSILHNDKILISIECPNCLIIEDALIPWICTEIISLMNGILSVYDKGIKIICKPSILKSIGSSSISYDVNSPFSSIISFTNIFQEKD